MIRIRIYGVMAAIGFVAIALAAVKNPTIWWASILFTLEVGLFSACAIVWCLRPRLRKGWVAGFAIAGAMYLHTTYAMTGATREQLFPPLLIEMVLLEYAETFNPQITLTFFEDMSENSFYTQIASSIGTIAFACCGAAFGGFLTRGGREES